MERTRLVNHWLELVTHLATTRELRFTHHGMRRIVEDVVWHVPAQVWDSGVPSGFSSMGYKNDSSKMKQLARNYFNHETVAAANAKLKKRMDKGSSQTSVAVMMGAGKKSSLSMGYCMQSIVASHTKEGIRVVAFYRSTEVIQKFFADLKFLHEFIFPQLFKGIDMNGLLSVRFQFVNAYVSAMFFPLVYQFEDPTAFLKRVERADKPFWRLAAVDAARMYRKDTVHSFRLHANMYEFYQTLKHVDHARLKKYLKHHGLVGKTIKMEKRPIEEEDDD